MLLALICAVSLFSEIVDELVSSNFAISIDQKILDLISYFQSEELDSIFFLITLLGKAEVIILLASSAIVFLMLWKKYLYIAPFLVSIVGSQVMTYIGKRIFERSRPAVSFYPETSFSFPSGHASVAVAFYGFLAYVFIRESLAWKTKVNIFFSALSVIVLIGISRIYLGVHYPSDVGGGFLSGVMWLILAIGFSEYFYHKKKYKNKSL